MKSKISIRISDSLREKLSEIAEIQEISVSELSRTILEDFVEASSQNTLENNDKVSTQNHHVDINNSFNVYDEFENQDQVFSTEFFQLVLWVYDQKNSKLFKFSKEELNKLKNTIIKIHSSTILPNLLKEEFNKVLVDLIKEIRSTYNTYQIFDFTSSYNNGFNYSLLTDFVFKENFGSKNISI